MTAQLDRWRGQFGDSYIDRNRSSDDFIDALAAMFRPIIGHCPTPPRSIIEIGANIGNNLVALSRLLADPVCIGVEPNAKARDKLTERGFKAINGVAQQIPLPDASADLAFTAGVLIHIHPDDLTAAYREIHRVSSRYILSLEYFADRPEQKSYWGSDDQLFKRDFGELWLELFPELKIAGYGFVWRRASGVDNLNWWLFEKRQV